MASSLVAKTFDFAYHSAMKRACPSGFFCLIFALTTACSSPHPVSKPAWQGRVQEQLAQHKEHFQACGKHINVEGPKAAQVSMTFKLSPEGELESLWLDEQQNWPQPFYDCLFNAVNQITFPSAGVETSLEIQQELIFQPRI